MTDGPAPDARRTRSWASLAGLLIVGALALSCALAPFDIGPWPAISARLWPVPTDPIEYHNYMLERLGSDAEKITIGAKNMRTWEPKPRVTLTDPGDIRVVLRNLRARPQPTDRGHHKCLGNILFVIHAGDARHEVHYDHASSIYPISEKPFAKRPGLDLTTNRAKALNALLLEKGFTKQEIGIE